MVYSWQADGSRTIEQIRYRAVFGVVSGLAAALIAAGWLVITRMGCEQTLSGYDIVALRYGIAALVILPLAIRTFSRLTNYNWKAWLLLVLGGGFPYGLVAVWGLNFAPAAHGGALIAGTIPTFTALLGAAFLAQTLSRRQIIGFALTLVGASAIGGAGLFDAVGLQTLGHSLFLLGAILWAIYTIALRRFGIVPMEATAIVCLSSAVIYVPVYPFIVDSQIMAAPWSEVLFQGFYQGLLAGVLFFFAFNRAVELLGSARGAVFLAMVPVLAAIMAMPVLGEYPGSLDIVGIVAATIGVYLVTNARLGTS